MNNLATELFSAIRFFGFLSALSFAGLPGLARGEEPTLREGGTVRQSSAEPGLYVLALSPAREPGKTTKERPTLLWYISKPTRHEVELRVTALASPATRAAQAVRDVHVFHMKHGVGVAGIQEFDLAKRMDDDGNHANLSVGVTYEWGVEILVHPGGNDAADDPSSIVKLLRVEMPPAVVEAAGRQDALLLLDAYRTARLWNDALAAITDLIGSAPDDRRRQELRKLRRELLLQPEGYMEENEGISDQSAR